MAEKKQHPAFPPPLPPRFLSLAAAAAYLSISVRQFQYLRERHGIPDCQPDGKGAALRFDREDLDRFMLAHRVTPASDSDIEAEARELAR